MEIIKLDSCEKYIKYPTIVKADGDYYLMTKKYHPDSNKLPIHIAMNLTNGEWFEWDCDPEDIFEGKIELYDPGTIFKIIL